MKKTVFLVCASFICILMLFSCKNSENTPNKDGTPGKDDITSDNAQKDGVVWAPGSDLYVVVENESHLNIEEFIYTLKYGCADSGIFYVSNSAEKKGSELVIGNTSREASAKAYRALEAVLESKSGKTGWLIYAYNGSLCLAYDKKAFLEEAITYFTENLMPQSTLSLSNGIVTSKTVDEYEYAEILRNEVREEGFAELEKKLGEGGAEIVFELKKFYSLVSEKTYKWLLNLYCPDNGGFYYSQAARDNEGFLPDVESTAQALGWLNDMGFMSDYDNNYANALPEEIRKQIVSFVIDLQGEDGYFYHPQWGYNISDSRRGRDLGWAVGILNAFGVKPNYSTPSGVAGSDVSQPVSEIRLTSPLSREKAVSVSHIVGTAAAVPEHLETIENFKKYLEDKQQEDGWYATGNTVSAQRGQIINRDNETGLPFKQTVIDFFDDGQNSSTGLWGEDINIEAVNGFMKITGNYASFGVPLNYIDTALESIINVALNPDPEGAGSPAVSVYNIFTSLSNILTITKKTVGETEVEKYRARILEDYAEILKVAYETNLPLICEDGGFSYTPKSSSATSQGVPVTLVGKKEGDVNSLTLCTSGLFDYMFRILGEVKIPAFTEFDGEIFIDELVELGTIIKNESNITGDYAFDDYDLGTIEMDGFNGIGEVVLDESLSSGNHVLQFKDEDDRAGASIAFTFGKTAKDFNSYVFEFDFKINNSFGDTLAVQLFLDDGLGKPVFGNTIYVRNFAADCEKYELDFRTLVGDNIGGSQVIAKATVPNEYNKIRLEYYYELGVVVLYLNDSFIGSTATLYNAVTVSYPERGRIYTTYPTLSDIYVDNVLVKPLTREVHPDAEIPEKNVPSNKDGNYDFDDSTTNTITVDGVTRLKNNGTLRVELDPYNSVNKIFRFVDNSDSSANGLYFKLMEDAPDYLNAFVFEFDMRVNSYSKKDGFIQFGFRDDKQKDIISTTVYIRCFEEDSYIIEFRTQTDGSISGTNGKLLGGVTVDNGINNIKYVYIPTDKTLAVYVNGGVVAKSTVIYNESAASLTPAEAKIYSGSSTLIDFNLDNVKVVKEQAQLPADEDIPSYTPPAVDTTPSVNTVISDGIYNFDNMLSGAAVNGTTITGNNNHIIADDKVSAANKVLNFIDDSGDVYRSVSLAIQNPFSDGFNAYVAEFDFRLNYASGGLIQFGMVDAGGVDIFKINATISDFDGSESIYTIKFSNSTSPYAKIGNTVTVDTSENVFTKIRFELYKDGFVLVYVDGTLLGLTEDVFADNLDKNIPAKAKIASTSTSVAEFEIDNAKIVTETLISATKPDIPETGDGEQTDPPEGGESTNPDNGDNGENNAPEDSGKDENDNPGSGEDQNPPSANDPNYGKDIDDYDGKAWV